MTTQQVPGLNSLHCKLCRKAAGIRSPAPPSPEYPCAGTLQSPPGESCAPSNCRRACAVPARSWPLSLLATCFVSDHRPFWFRLGPAVVCVSCRAPAQWVALVQSPSASCASAPAGERHPFMPMSTKSSSPLHWACSEVTQLLALAPIRITVPARLAQ